MKLSDKMPSQMDPMMSPRMPAQMESNAPPYAGEGGSDDPAVVPIVNQSSYGSVTCQSISQNSGPAWETADNKTGSAWMASDRKNETDKGSLPQRDPDNDGDLN